MRTEFNNLVDLMNKYSLYHSTDEVGIALSELEQKITEFEKRIECARRSNQDSNSIIISLVDSFQDLGKTKEELTYGDFETLQRGVYDVDIALNFNDKEPIENNWYGLFDEPKQENVSRETLNEPKVIWGKGTIIEWNESVKYYSAKGGARARVTEDYTTLCEMVKVEFLDDLSNGQVNGGYYGYMFKDKPIKETPPTELCKTPQTHEFVKDIIAKLKVIDVDGETMQYIIEQVGMSEQIHRQLVMENDYKVTKDLLREKFELEL